MNIVRKVGRTVKAWFYRHKYKLMHAPKNVYFGGHSKISSDLVLGEYVFIGNNCEIYPKVTIGDYTLIARYSSIIGGDHIYNKAGTPIIFSGRDEIKPTKIGKDCWIGAHSLIMCGVTIGDGSIIAAGSIVTKDVEPYSIYGGVPAKKIKDRFASEEDLIKHKACLEGKSNTFGNELLCGNKK